MANLSEFNEKINNKKNKLLQLFLRFDDDEIRNSPSSILRMINYYEILFEKIKKKIMDDINNKKTNKIINEKDKSDGLYFKNILIISDMYFIILHIIKENRQKGKMKFFLELNKLKEIKVFSKENKINLVREEDALLKDNEYKHEIVF